MIAYAAQPILAFRIGDLLKVDGGVALLVDADHVLSVQPDGSYERRLKDAIGPWETAQQSGDKLVYHHYDHGEVFVVPVVTL